jgi:hypothetical protein
MQTVVRISVGFSHERHKPWPAWQKRHGWPALNLKHSDPNVYYYIAGRKTTDDRFLGRLT